MDKNDEREQAGCVILADGDYPTHAIPLGILRSAEYVCCCDRAAEAFIAHGNTPSAIVGDGDSLPEELKRQYADRLHIVNEQDYNDLTKATRHCISQGYSHIAYLGCTGKREDHTIGNISLMLYYMKELGISPVMYTDHGYFIPASGTQTFKSYKGQQVSIFRGTATEFSSDGLKWDAYDYEQAWQGTLNEALSDSFTIHSNGTYIVFLTY